MSSPYVSLIVPAYNEEHRIKTTLRDIYAYTQAQPYTSEVIVVDDGSTDATLAILQAAQSWFPNLCVIANQHRGKAVAVRTGVFAARGTYIVFTDADLSTPLTEMSRLLAALEQGAAVAIGSRECAGSQRVGEPAYRHIMGRGFNLLVALLLRQPFRDTQCGFKAFRRAVAERLFRQSRLYTEDSPILTRSAVTAFDVEILFLALQNGYQVREIPVEWYYRPGSKVSPLVDSLSLLADVLQIRWNAFLGHYLTVGDEPALSQVESP